MNKSKIDERLPEPQLNQGTNDDVLPSAQVLPNPMLAAALIHFGCAKYDVSKFIPVSNENWCKPKGGLWTSPINSKWGWKDWCQTNNFRDCNFKNSFKIKLKETTNVFIINTLLDLKNAPLVDCKIGNSYEKRHLDFEHIAKSYDAIWLTEKGQNQTHLSYPLNLYGWDCESVLILNPKCILEVA